MEKDEFRELNPDFGVMEEQFVTLYELAEKMEIFKAGAGAGHNYEGAQFIQSLKWQLDTAIKEMRIAMIGIERNMRKLDGEVLSRGKEIKKLKTRKPRKKKTSGS